MTIEELREFEGADKLTDAQLSKILHLINRMPEDIRAMKAEELIAVI